MRPPVCLSVIYLIRPSLQSHVAPCSFPPLLALALRLRPTPDPALYPSQIPFSVGALETNHGPVVERMWAGRQVNSLLALNEFADALSGLWLSVCACTYAYVCVCMRVCVRAYYSLSFSRSLEPDM